VSNNFSDYFSLPEEVFLLVPTVIVTLPLLGQAGLLAQAPPSFLVRLPLGHPLLLLHDDLLLSEFLVQISTHSQGLKDYYSPDEKKPGWMVRAFSVCVEVC
jgi:hypothetical protein